MWNKVKLWVTYLATAAIKFIQTPEGRLVMFSVAILIPWVVGWVRNAEYNTKYNLTELRDMYLWVATQINARHLIDSKWNSLNGQPPTMTPPGMPAPPWKG